MLGVARLPLVKAKLVTNLSETRGIHAQQIVTLALACLANIDRNTTCTRYDNVPHALKRTNATRGELAKEHRPVSAIPGRGTEQRDGQLRGRNGVTPWSVHDQHPLTGGLCNVDVVDSYARAADNLHVCCLT